MSSEQIYDWRRELDFASRFERVAVKAVSDLEKSKKLIARSVDGDLVTDNPITQSKRLLLLLNALPRSVASYFNDPDNYNNRSITLAHNELYGSRISFGNHNPIGKFQYGLLYFSDSSLDPVPVTPLLIDQLGISDKFLIKEFASRSKIGIIELLIEEISLRG